MNLNINLDICSIAYHQGISDFLHYNTRCPIYWKGTAEGALWQEGYNYARNYNNG